jgi:hypothetical protein
MAHLWVRDEAEQWAVMPLEHAALSLTPGPPRPVASLADARALPANVLMLRTGETDPAWVLVAGSGAGVSVNGMPLAVGIRVLADRDEIRVSSADSYFFSTENLAIVEEFPASDQTLFCPRCKQDIEKGTEAVRCPACGVWHHQTEELNCWTYSDVCALCAHPTELNGGFRWTPEEL